MNKLNIVIIILIILISIMNITNKAYAAADINKSYDTDIKIFGNWKAYILNLNNGKKYIGLEGQCNPISLFRILFDKSKAIAYFNIHPNDRNLPEGTNQKGTVLLSIGDRTYNIETTLTAHGRFIIGDFNMPNELIKLLQQNKFFTIQYLSHVPADPIMLNGFNKALQYVKQLQNKL